MRVLQRALGALFLVLVGLGLFAVGPSPALASVSRELGHVEAQVVRVSVVLERVGRGARGLSVAVADAVREVGVAQTACASSVGALLQQLVPQARSLCGELGPLAAEVEAGGRTLGAVRGRLVAFEAEAVSVRRRLEVARTWVGRVRIAADVLLALEILWGVVAGVALARRRRVVRGSRAATEALA